MTGSTNTKAVSQCTEAVVNHYGVTFACMGSSLEKLNQKQGINISVLTLYQFVSFRETYKCCTEGG